MADDIDDLLDEVESKYVKDQRKDQRITKAKPSRLHFDSGYPHDGRADKDSYPHDSNNQCIILRKRVEDEEVDQMIEDICEDSDPIEKCNTPRSVPSNSSQKRASSSKCFPVYLGGTNCSQGYANSFNKRSCDKLRCTSCDFQVASFEDFEWHSSVDYLFLRNNVPDFHRLKSKLCRKKGCRAYCCQCSSVSMSQLQEVKDLQVKWVCGQHST